MHDLTHFSLRDMTLCGAALRNSGSKARTVEEAARLIVGYLFERLVDEQGQRACALVRFLQTTSFAALPADLKALALAADPAAPPLPDTKCLALLATQGERPEWTARTTSGAYQVIPLVAETMIDRFPMVTQLIVQMGLTPSEVARPDPRLMASAASRSYGVFHVEEASGSPYLASQQGIIVPHAVRSVLGFGGMLPSGNLFATLLFSKVTLSKRTAEMFQTIGLSVKLAMLPLADKPLFGA